MLLFESKLVTSLIFTRATHCSPSTQYMASHLPSSQAKKGDQSLHLARNLRDEWKDVIPEDDINTIQNRITMCVILPHWHGMYSGLIFFIIRATEMRVGLDSKKVIPRFFHARAYRKYAQETYYIARVFVILSKSPREMTYLVLWQTVSDRVRDFEFSASSQQTYGDAEQLLRTTVTAEATYRSFLSCKELFPTPEQESNWVKSVWPVACNKTGARLNPPSDLAERVCLDLLVTTHSSPP